MGAAADREKAERHIMADPQRTDPSRVTPLDKRWDDLAFARDQALYFRTQMAVQDERAKRTAIYDHWREEAELWDRIVSTLSEALSRPVHSGMVAGLRYSKRALPESVDERADGGAETRRDSARLDAADEPTQLREANRTLARQLERRADGMDDLTQTLRRELDEERRYHRSADSVIAQLRTKLRELGHFTPEELAALPEPEETT